VEENPLITEPGLLQTALDRLNSPSLPLHSFSALLLNKKDGDMALLSKSHDNVPGARLTKVLSRAKEVGTHHLFLESLDHDSSVGPELYAGNKTVSQMLRTVIVAGLTAAGAGAFSVVRWWFHRRAKKKLISSKGCKVE
jgi:hypothetical protein